MKWLRIKSNNQNWRILLEWFLQWCLLIYLSGDYCVEWVSIQRSVTSTLYWFIPRPDFSICVGEWIQCSCLWNKSYRLWLVIVEMNVWTKYSKVKKRKSRKHELEGKSDWTKAKMDTVLFSSWCVKSPAVRKEAVFFNWDAVAMEAWGVKRRKSASLHLNCSRKWWCLCVRHL